MKSIFLVLMLGILGIGLTGCGMSEKERKAREEAAARQRADSLALVEKGKARIEQRRADSLANVEKRRIRMEADSAVKAELLPNFTEFKNTPSEGMTTFIPKTAPKGHKQNSCFLSFYADNGVAKDLSVNIDYTASDWLFIKTVELVVDDENFTLTPDKTDSKVWEDGRCSEWFSISIGTSLINKLEDAKNVTVEYRGNEGTKTISLSKTQIKGMADTVKLFKAMGG